MVKNVGKHLVETEEKGGVFFYTAIEENNCDFCVALVEKGSSHPRSPTPALVK